MPSCQYPTGTRGAGTLNFKSAFDDQAVCSDCRLILTPSSLLSIISIYLTSTPCIFHTYGLLSLATLLYGLPPWDETASASNRSGRFIGRSPR